jgi:acetyl-CoA carboxylase biotin carboxyl carrier protein
MTKSSRSIDQDLIRELAALLTETDLSEIEVEQDGLRIRVARTMSVAASAPAPAPASGGATPAARPAPAADDAAQHPGAVTSPMVGTAYVAPEPGAQPFVSVGSQVKAGQTVMIVEAMKTMNPIPAPRGGTVTSILISDGQPVEYGEPLLIIE